MRLAAVLALSCLSFACQASDAADVMDDTGEGDDSSFEQPGLDDPTAREWSKAGIWYPEDWREIDEAVETLIAEVDDVQPRRATAILPPHASLKYSGPTGKEVWSRVAIPDTVLILAPDHWGDGEPTAVWTEGPWLVPGHAVEIDRGLLERVQAALPDLVSDRVAFSHHETEMLLPWLTTINHAVKIVPISIFDNEHTEYRDFDMPRIEAWGLAVADLLRSEAAAGREVLLIGTTDLVHHETLALSDEQDAAVMALVTALDVQGLYDYVIDNEVSVCGEIPVSIMMVALRELGHESMELLERGNSFHVKMDDSDIIGYPAAAAWAP
ncbi:MAG: AmmeMemoRadiSam system protein B [Nannocystaceae bacterium]|nr:AmmeMemoRadiSam system protein B [Nannocystaceae bacterium]